MRYRAADRLLSLETWRSPPPPARSRLAGALRRTGVVVGKQPRGLRDHGYGAEHGPWHTLVSGEPPDLGPSGAGGHMGDQASGGLRCIGCPQHQRVPGHPRGPLWYGLSSLLPVSQDLAIHGFSFPPLTDGCEAILPQGPDDLSQDLARRGNVRCPGPASMARGCAGLGPVAPGQPPIDRRDSVNQAPRSSGVFGETGRDEFGPANLSEQREAHGWLYASGA